MIYEFGFNDVEMAAKTGTTNDNVDTWFMCAVPNLVMGVWVGGEEPSVHFTSSAGGSRMALPVAGKFLTKVYNDGTLGVLRNDRFVRPAELPDYNCDGAKSESEESVMDGEDVTSGGDDEFFD
jgi:penicillin-binding protein 1A